MFKQLCLSSIRKWSSIGVRRGNPANVYSSPLTIRYLNTQASYERKPKSMGQGVRIEDGCIVNKNPATGEEISRVPCTSIDDLDKKVAEAKKASAAWMAMEASERIALLKKGLDELSKKTEELQRKITEEMGKPFEEAKEEVEWVLDKGDFLDILENSLKPKKHGSSVVVRQALGIVAILSPWNFPADEILFLMLPALVSLFDLCTICAFVQLVLNFISRKYFFL